MGGKGGLDVFEKEKNLPRVDSKTVSSSPQS
jgi:hypothetical protein